MRILSVSLIVLFVILTGCESEKKSKKQFPPFTINNVSKDSTIITVGWQEYQQKLKKENRYKKIVMGDQYSREVRENTSLKVFKDLIREKKLKHELNYLGIEVTKAEENDFIQGDHIHPKIKSFPMFQDRETGKFSKKLIPKFLKQLKSRKNSEPYFIWQYEIDKIRKQILEDKYESLLKASMFMTDNMEKWYDKLSIGKSAITLAGLPYNKYYDSLELTDAQYKEYLQEKAYDYQTNGKRYLKAAHIPTKIHKHFHEKEHKTFSRYLKTYDKFDKIAAENNKIKAFSSYFNVDAIPEDLKSFFNKAKIGDIHGPYYKKNSYRVIKLVKKTQIPEKVKAQHLVIDGIDQQKITEIKKEIKQSIASGKTFLDLAKQYADKFGEAGKWGDLDWFQHAEMVKAFSDSAFLNKPGEMVISKSQFGWHIINILDHKDIAERYYFTALYWSLKPSEKDIKATMQKAETFAASVKNPENFEDKASENYYPVKSYEGEALLNELRNLKNSKPVLKWAFNVHKGAISKPFFINNKVYVFKLDEIGAPGTMPLFDAKQYIETAVRLRAVKTYLKENLNLRQLNKLSLNKISTTLRMDKQNVTDIHFLQNKIANAGRDPYMVGAVDVAKPGEKSRLYLGKKGLFVWQKTNEKPVRIKDDYHNNILKQWYAAVDNDRYKLQFRLNDHLTINRLRKQDSYFLVPAYHDTLKSDKKLGKKMFDAEYAFRQKNYQKALEGDQNFTGFRELAKNPVSKQQRLAAIYAGLSALQTGKYDEAISTLSKIKTEDRFFSVIIKGVQGDALTRQGKFKAAIAKYKAAEKANKNFIVCPKYLLKLAAIYDALGEYSKALESLKLIRDKYPQAKANFDIAKYIARYEYLTDKSQVIVKQP